MTCINEDICCLDDQLLSSSSSSSSPEPLSQSCPESLLRENCLPLDISTGDCLDDDLKELGWLQKRHLLRELQPSVGIVEPIDSSGLESDSECDELDGHSLSPTGHNVPSDGCYSPSSILHCSPSIVSYNPTENPQAKPPYSFSCLIFMAIEEAAEKRLPVKDIYKWIMDKFPYFRSAPTGWKNSVRHNLSLNKCFKKVDKEKGQAIGKGSLWCIDTDYRPNLLQALKRTPYHPFHQLQMLSQPHVSQSTILTRRYMESLPPFLRHLNTPSPQLFPNLSKKFGVHDSSSASSNNGAESVSDSEVNAASTLMMFKKANTDSKRRLKRAASPEDVARSRKRMRSWMRTSTPRRKQLLKVKMKSPVSRTVTDDSAKSADHTYSAENHSSSDADESDMDECDSATKRALPVRKSKRKSTMPRKIKRARPKKSKEDEQLKVAEGADALLNLAGVKTSSLVPMVALSPSSNNNNSEDVVNQNMVASKS